MASILDSSKSEVTVTTEQDGRQNSPKSDMPKTLRVKIAAPYNVYYDDEAESVSAENETGPFDVLNNHHSFMSLLTPGEILVKNSRGEEAFKISRGIMYVHQNSVRVFLDV